jgi:predicted metal-binding protein
MPITYLEMPKEIGHCEECPDELWYPNCMENNSSCPYIQAMKMFEKEEAKRQSKIYRVRKLLDQPQT